MKSRTLLNLLVAIILSFTIKGFFTLQDIDESIKTDQTQQVSMTQDIGMAFDWYGLTVVDSVVKYTHNIISSEELVEILKDGRAEKDELLKRYYLNATAVENEFLNRLKQQDVKVDLFIDKVISQATNRRYQTDESMIGEMYTLTQPAVDTINTIIKLKTEYSINTKALIHESVESFEYFLSIASVLAIAVCISGNIKYS